MILGVDASNVRAGGGLTHLRELLAAAEPEEAGFTRVIVWGGRNTLEKLPRRSWLDARHEPLLDRALPFRLLWQQGRLSSLARQACDVLFAPGGLALTSFHPRVLVSQNMLPFEHEERARYGISRSRLRLELLTHGQARSFARADGLIFLSDHARRVVSARLGGAPRRFATIPHGVDPRFLREPTESRRPPRRLLYVSTVSPYKHQWNVIEAVGALRSEGFDVSLDLVGGSDHPPSLARMCAAGERVDPRGEFIRYRGLIPFEELHAAYHQADVFIFASTCENLPNILIEAMASGLPIACSNRGPMPEVLGGAGVYFDPLSATSTAGAVRSLLADAPFRRAAALSAYHAAQAYSWQRCARDSLSFIAAVARE